MSTEKTTRELVYETNRDVKWICRTLQRMEARGAFHPPPRQPHPHGGDSPSIHCQ